MQKQVYFIDYVCFVLESRLAFLAALPFRSSLDEDVLVVGGRVSRSFQSFQELYSVFCSVCLGFSSVAPRGACEFISVLSGR